MPERNFEFFGVDVADSGVQPDGFFAATISRLTDAHPAIDWAARLHLIASGDAWPFADGYLSVVISNQVLEHVYDHSFFMAEHYRVLRDDGFGFHLFPFKHYIYEGHLNLPLVHRIGQYRRLKSYIAMCSNLGLGKYKEHRDKYRMSIEEYSEEHADYMTFMTNYLSSGECLDICKRARLRADFRFTEQYYLAKARLICRARPKYSYSERIAWLDGVGFQIWKRIASITLFVQKKQTYSR